MHQKSNDGQSKWAAFVDPTGAAFGIIPAVADEDYPASDREDSGHIAWLSLTVPDANSSQDFYQNVLGWSSAPIDSAGVQGGIGFEMRMGDEPAVAEILAAEDVALLPAVWMIHLPVGVFAESVQKVAGNGGHVVLQDDERELAVIRDPVGVCFAFCGSGVC